MNKTIPLTKGTLLAVQIEPHIEYINPLLISANNESLFFETDEGEKYDIDIPTGDWTLLGKPDEVTEEMAKSIVDNDVYIDPHAQPYPIPCYKGYIDNVWKWNALESFQSLLQANQIYTVNRYGKNPVKNHHYIESEQYIADELISLHSEAQKHLANWILLWKDK